jgi:hypothetical protein
MESLEADVAETKRAYDEAITKLRARRASQISDAFVRCVRERPGSRIQFEDVPCRLHGGNTGEDKKCVRCITKKRFHDATLEMVSGKLEGELKACVDMAVQSAYTRAQIVALFHADELHRLGHDAAEMISERRAEWLVSSEGAVSDQEGEEEA